VNHLKVIFHISVDPSGGVFLGSGIGTGSCYGSLVGKLSRIIKICVGGPRRNFLLFSFSSLSKILSHDPVTILGLEKVLLEGSTLTRKMTLRLPPLRILILAVSQVYKPV